MRKRRSSTAPFTAGDVRLILNSPVYAYGINLQPSERVAEAVMHLNTQLAREMHDTGATFTLEELDRRFQMMLSELEASGTCIREMDHPPLVSKEQWLQVQLKTIEKLSRGEQL